MSQSKKSSLFEACVNVAIGYFVALGTQLLVFPMFNIHIPMRDNLLIGVLFTITAIIRMYFVRRLFNKGAK